MRSLGDMMGTVLEQTGSAVALTPVWSRMVGEMLARHSRPVRWEGTTLFIRCDDEGWRAALEAERPRLARKLATALGKSASSAIVFEVG